jgi:hypothetical protein
MTMAGFKVYRKMLIAIPLSVLIVLLLFFLSSVISYSSENVAGWTFDANSGPELGFWTASSYIGANFQVHNSDQRDSIPQHGFSHILPAGCLHNDNFGIDTRPQDLPHTTHGLQ